MQRLPLIQRGLAALEPDFVALQEVLGFTGLLSFSLEQPPQGETPLAEYGFLVSIRASGGGPWTPLEAVSGDASWQWSSFTAWQAAGVWKLSGVIQQFQDRQLGTAQRLDVKQGPRREMNLRLAADFRIHVVPLWDFWDWDETGYEAQLIIRDPADQD